MLGPQKKERNKGQKKYLSEQQRSEEVGPLDLAGPTAEKEDQVITVSGQADNAEKPGESSPGQPQNVSGCSGEPASHSGNELHPARERQTPTMRH